ncbi:MAG: hypothetical protein H8E87_04610 [FCB group bacterium]|nr:hypothetical protein [FCB group bacterium]
MPLFALDWLNRREAVIVGAFVCFPCRNSTYAYVILEQLLSPPAATVPARLAARVLIDNDFKNANKCKLCSAQNNFHIHIEVILSICQVQNFIVRYYVSL